MRPRGAIFPVLCCFCLIALGALPARGQVAASGTIAGTVSDNTGAVIPDVSITLTNIATAGTRVTKSNSKGQYIFAFVDPGTYFVKFDKQGFQSKVVSNQTVSVGLQLNVNATLQVGSVTTVVTVTSTAGADLQTLNATVGTDIGEATLMNLPNPGRDASTLAVLQPASNTSGYTAGVFNDQNSFQLDGGFASDDMSGSNSYVNKFATNIAAVHTTPPSGPIPIPVTSIQDFKVATANQTADFNGGAGSQVQIATKRGTNTFHGTVYDYYSDNNFGGANTWDNNRTGKAQPSSHFSRFGAAAGGKIPHSNFLGSGWYVFGNYEGFRYPLSATFEKNFPLPSLRSGIIHLNGKTVNLNPFPVVDSGCGSASRGCNVTTTGMTIQPTMCPAGPCDPRGLGTTMNGQLGGPLNPVMTLWNTYLPLPNDCGQGDGLNYCGYKGTIATPQSSNFGVMRIDHDFTTHQHFNATYHYYKLANASNGQWDIGGFFPGDSKGQYAAKRSVPQNTWLYTLGLTTDVSATVTNDFHFSLTRNWWAYASFAGVPNVAGYPAALEVGGENNNPFAPYDTYNQGTRTRFWDGLDYMWRDDVTWIRGNHLLQLGGLYQRNDDTHARIDNGQSINTFEQYLVGAGLSKSLAPFGINMKGYVPAGITSTSKYGDLYSMILGMVDESQSLYTRSVGSTLGLRPRTSCAIPGVAATSGCISSPAALNESIFPFYNLYLTDAWHLKPTFTLNYGLGYMLALPAYEVHGGYQTVVVDQQGNMLYSEQYLQQVQQAALQGLGYAPLLGFSAIRNVPNHSHYPYDPFYGGISPRIGIAWNFRPDSVLRAGYSRIFGRINGVDPVLAELLTPGLMQPATCGGPNITGGCGGTPANVFRVGVDGKNAPLAAPSQNLPQPWYPGFNDVATGAGQSQDPNLQPNRSDEFTVSIQHQLNPKILVEAGYIGRIIANEFQFYNYTAVPYMMTMGGQSFANAWKNIMLATHNGNTNLSGVPVQPFFETALAPAYCKTYSSCTAAFVAHNGVTGNKDMTVSDPFDAWATVSKNGNWTFGRSFTSDPINSPFGANGQSPALDTTVSNGYGNYHGGYLQMNFSNWHGLTFRSNFTWSKALGTGASSQSASSGGTVDQWNLANDYGLQSYDQKWVFNLFFNYQEPFFKEQKGFVGRALGGWSIAPIFILASGFPIEAHTSNGDCGTYGECNTAYFGAFENEIITGNLNYSASRKQGVKGKTCGTAGAGQNVFANPDAACALFRDPILGLDGNDGGAGVLRGLPFWNLDLDLTKNLKFKERYSGSIYFSFTNVLNHMQPNDPRFDASDLSTFGVLGALSSGAGNVQGNEPRRLQIGLSIDW